MPGSEPGRGWAQSSAERWLQSCGGQRRGGLGAAPSPRAQLQIGHSPFAASPQALTAQGTVAHWSPAPLEAHEGFSSIDLHAPPGETAVLAAGSELGNVHVWECWRRDDAVRRA